MSLSCGQTVAGLLNATFGNAVEIIVGLTALFKDEIQLVQASVRSWPCIFARQALNTRRCSGLFYLIFSWF